MVTRSPSVSANRADTAVTGRLETGPNTRGQLKLVSRAKRASNRIAAMQPHVVASQIHFGALGQVIEDRPVQGLLVAVVEARRRVESTDVRIRDIAVAVVRGVLHAHLLIAEFVVDRALRGQLKRHGPGVVLTLAERALIAQVTEVTRIGAQNTERVVTTRRPRLV